MSKPQIGNDEWAHANPGRYAVYPHGNRWHVIRGAHLVGDCSDQPKTLPEAMDAAYADAEARAALVPTC